MASNTPRTLSSFQVSDVAFSAVMKNKMGGKAVYLNHAKGGKLMFQLPLLKAPFGLSEYMDSATGKVTSTSVPINLDDPDILASFQEIDTVIIDFIVKHSEEIMGKKMTKDILLASDLYKPIVKMPSKEGFSPFITLKVMTNTAGEITTEAYDSKRRPTDIRSLEKKQLCNTIIDINQIWRTPAGVGVSVRLLQIMLGAVDKLKPCAFKFENQDEEEEEDIEIDCE